MLAEIRSDVVAQLLTPELAPTGKLRDFKHVQAGDQSLRSDLHPGVTFDWRSYTDLKPGQGKFEWKIGFYATAYSSSLLHFEAGAEAHMKLLCRPEGATLVGLLPALAKLYGGYSATNGQSFKVTFDPNPKSFSGKGKNQQFWSYRTEVHMMFETWLNPSQIL